MATAPTPAAAVGDAPSAAQISLSPPGTDMTGICFRDQLWLNTYPLDSNLVFDYFALSPFYDPSCNNEALRLRSIHPLDTSHLSKMTGIEYVLSEAMEPHVFVIRKQRRESPELSKFILCYYVLDGSVYQAPLLCSVFYSRISRVTYHISKAFNLASSKLEKIGHAEPDSEVASSESKVQKEAIDIKELKRIDYILATLQRKLPPAPPPPAFAEGYIPPVSTEGEKRPDAEQLAEGQLPPMDPIIDQGPSKRPRYQ